MKNHTIREEPIEWLSSIPHAVNGGEFVYSLEQIRKSFEVRELCLDAYLVLKRDPEKIFLNFAVLDLAYSCAGGTFLKAVFWGEGPTGSLRECRHTYWGDQGYLFYADGRVICAAFKALSEFFDLMA